MIDRESAWCLLTEFTQSESLRKHALAVEACMRACARKYSSYQGNGSYHGMPSGMPQASAESTAPSAAEGPNSVDEDLWGVVGLIHSLRLRRTRRIHYRRGADQAK